MENIKPASLSDFQVLANKYSKFLKELRKRIILVFAVFAIGTSVGFIFVQYILKFLLTLLNLNGVNIIFTSPFQFINLSISFGIATGVIFVFPLIIYQLMSFLKPALKQREYRIIIGFLPFSIVLFLIGFAVGIYMMKLQIVIFLGQTSALGVGNMLDITRLLSTVVITSVLLGVAFQCPIVIILLMRIGLVRREQLSKIRIWVYLASFVFAVLLPPDSIIFDLLATLPLVILFELTLILDHILDKKKKEPVILKET